MRGLKLATSKIRINSRHELAPRYFIIIILRTKNDLKVIKMKDVL